MVQKSETKFYIVTAAFVAGLLAGYLLFGLQSEHEQTVQPTIPGTAVTNEGSQPQATVTPMGTSNAEHVDSTQPPGRCENLDYHWITDRASCEQEFSGQIDVGSSDDGAHIDIWQGDTKIATLDATPFLSAEGVWSAWFTRSPEWNSPESDLLSIYLTEGAGCEGCTFPLPVFVKVDTTHHQATLETIPKYQDSPLFQPTTGSSMHPTVFTTFVSPDGSWIAYETGDAGQQPESLRMLDVSTGEDWLLLTMPPDKTLLSVDEINIHTLSGVEWEYDDTLSVRPFKVQAEPAPETPSYTWTPEKGLMKVE